MQCKAWYATTLVSVLLSLISCQFAVAETRTISGRIVDAQGAPVNGAEVSFLTQPSSEMFTVTTGDNGEFSFDADVQAKNLLFVQAKGFAPALQVFTAAALSTPVTFTLAAGHRLEGTLLDETGEPVVNARIAPVLDPLPEKAPPEIKDCSSLLPHTQSDLDGHFLLTSLPAGQVSLHIEVTGYRLPAKQAYPVDVPQKITLRRLGKIVARIVQEDSDKPVTRFAVTIVSTMNSGVSSGSSNGMQNAPDGAFFAYADGDSGHISLSIDAPGYLQKRVDDVVCSPEAKPVVIRLTHAGQLTGRITEQGSGAPLAGVLVTVQSGPGSDNSFLHIHYGNVPPAQARTDADGQFAVEARVTPAAVTLEKDGFGRLLLRDIDTAVPLQATLEKGATITGKILDAAGQPVNNRALYVYSVMRHTQYFQGGTQADGSFTVTDLPSGSYIVNEASTRSTTVRVRAGETVTVDWHGATGITVHGTVALSDGQIDGLPVTMAADDGAEYKTSTDQHGQFTCSPLAPGNYRIYIERRGDTPVTSLPFFHNVTIHTGDNQCDFTRLCAVSGRLVDAQSGKPLAKIALQAYVKSTWHDLIKQTNLLEQHVTPIWNPLSEAVTDEQGRFTINNLLPGEWLIARKAPDWIAGPVIVPPFTLHENERKTDIRAQMPPVGAAEISPVDAETGKTLPDTPVVYVDKWGYMFRPASHTSVHALPAGVYRAFPDRQYGFMPFIQSYPVSAVTFTVNAGQTTRGRLPLKRGGRLRIALQHPVAKQSTALTCIAYTLSTPDGNAPALSDAQGMYTGGLLVAKPGESECLLALPAETYHVELRLVTTSQPFISMYGSMPVGPVVVQQNVTIVPGKDIVLTVTE